MSRSLLTDRGKFYLELLFAVIILSFAFVFAAFFFKQIFINHDSNYISSTISAFLGAFVAFIFIRFTQFFDKIFQRQTKHRDSLTLLEDLGNRYLNTISDNIFLIDDFSEIAEKNIKAQQPFIYFNELHEFKYDNEIIRGLLNLEIINDVFSFEASVEKMNSSLRASNRFYLVIRDALVSGSIQADTYFTNVNNLLGKLNELKAFLLDLEDEDLQLMAKVRILIKDESNFYTRVLSRLLKKKLTADQTNRIPEERKLLEKEIEDTKKESKARIDAIDSKLKGTK